MRGEEHETLVAALVQKLKLLIFPVGSACSLQGELPISSRTADVDDA